MKRSILELLRAAKLVEKLYEYDADWCLANKIKTCKHCASIIRLRKAIKVIEEAPDAAQGGKS